MHILYMLLIGLAAGWLAGKVMKGRGFGILGNIIVGIIGGILGGRGRAVNMGSFEQAYEPRPLSARGFLAPRAREGWVPVKTLPGSRCHPAPAPSRRT